MYSVGHNPAGMQRYNTDGRQFHLLGHQSSEWLEQLLRSSWHGVGQQTAVRGNMPADCGCPAWSAAQLDRNQHGPIRHPRSRSKRRTVRNIRDFTM